MEIIKKGVLTCVFQRDANLTATHSVVYKDIIPGISIDIHAVGVFSDSVIFEEISHGVNIESGAFFIVVDIVV